MSNSYTKDDTIFVQISSYRDPELQHTIKDLFKKAKKPENIFVGICHQYDMKEGTDKHLFEVPFTSSSSQVRVDEMDYRESKGLFLARRKAQLLWRGEKWVAHFDAHMRYEEGWDEILVLMLKSLQDKGHDKPVVASHPPGYNPDTNELDPSYTTLLCIQTFNKVTGVIRPSACNHFAFKYCSPTALISGNFFATIGQYLQDVPYDVNMCFTDEANMAVRLWTNGYSLFNTDKNVCYHLWNTEKLKETRAKRADDGNEWYHNNVARSDARERHLFQIQKSNDPRVINDINKYGIGANRSLRDYERYAGIDFKKRLSKERVRQGLFEQWQEVSKINQVKKIFKRD